MDNYQRSYSYGNTGSQSMTFEERVVIPAYKNMYGWMAAALGISALSAFVTIDMLYRSEAFVNMMFNSVTMWVLFLGTFGLVSFLNHAIQRLSFGVATCLFALYAALMGMILAPVLLVYTASSVTQVFLITAGTFGGMAIYGHYTKRDLTKIGQIAIMALWGIILASVVNVFFHNDTMTLIMSYIGVVVFCALTMYDVQKFKRLIYSCGSSDEGDLTQRIALLGALSLYLDFINLFLKLLHILGKRR